MARDQETFQIKQEDGRVALSSGAVSSITFQILKGTVYLRFTASAVAPSEPLGQRWSAPQGRMKELISNLVHDGATSRHVWVKATDSSPATVYVDHD